MNSKIRWELYPEREEFTVYQASRMIGVTKACLEYLIRKGQLACCEIIGPGPTNTYTFRKRAVRWAHRYLKQSWEGSDFYHTEVNTNYYKQRSR